MSAANNPETTEPPWADCKVAFDADNEAVVWQWWDKGAPGLPIGWEMTETDLSGARLVVVFRVEGIPRREDGESVLALFRRIKAVRKAA